MPENQKILSVNQTHAQIKIIEMWKATNLKKYPNKVAQISHSNSDRITRRIAIGNLQENNTPSTCLGDAERLLQISELQNHLIVQE